MSKRAEDLAKKLFPDPRMEDYDDVLVYRADRDNAIIGRVKSIKIYEQAEKDTIERVISWVRKNAYIYTDTQNDEEGNLMTVFLEKAFIDDLTKAMEEEE